MNSKNTICLNTITDRLNFALHGTVMAGICASISYYYGMPALALVGVALGAVQEHGANYYASLLIEDSINDPEEGIQKMPSSEKLNQKIQKISHELNPKKEVPSLYITKSRIPSAAACETPRPIIFLSSGLLSTLSPEESEETTLHELAHILSGTQSRKRVVDFLHAAAAMTGTCCLITQVGYSLWHCCDGWQALAANAINTVSIFSVSILAERATAAVRKSCLRHAEFQMDRIACAMSQNPKGFIQMLRKLDKWEREYDHFTQNTTRWQRGICRLMKVAKGIFSAHPGVERRCARLGKGAKQEAKAAAPQY